MKKRSDEQPSSVQEQIIQAIDNNNTSQLAKLFQAASEDDINELEEELPSYGIKEYYDRFRAGNL